MGKWDLVLYYHSVSEKAVVGIAKVTRAAYPDSPAKEGNWSVVDLKPVKGLKVSVTLDAIKANKALEDMALIRQSRLSVMPLSAVQFRRVLKLGRTSL